MLLLLFQISSLDPFLVVPGIVAAAIFKVVDTTAAAATATLNVPPVIAAPIAVAVAISILVAAQLVL